MIHDLAETERCPKCDAALRMAAGIHFDGYQCPNGCDLWDRSQIEIGGDSHRSNFSVLGNVALGSHPYD